MNRNDRKLVRNITTSRLPVGSLLTRPFFLNNLIVFNEHSRINMSVLPSAGSGQDFNYTLN